MQMKQKSRPTIAETDKTDEKNIILKQKKKTKKKRHPDEWERENGRTQKGGKLIHKKTKTGMDSEKMIPVHKRGK